MVLQKIAEAVALRTKKGRPAPQRGSLYNYKDVSLWTTQTIHSAGNGPHRSRCAGVVSAFFVPPDMQYLGYIDLRTLAILFSLMTVMAGCGGRGFLMDGTTGIAVRTHSTFQLTLVLVGLCFFRKHVHHQRCFPGSLRSLHVRGPEPSGSGCPPGTPF